MSHTHAHGDLSGAVHTPEFSACDHSLTHITLGTGPNVQQCPPPHHSLQESQQAQHQYQQQYQQQHQQQHQQHQQYQQQYYQQPQQPQHSYQPAGRQQAAVEDSGTATGTVITTVTTGGVRAQQQQQQGPEGYEVYDNTMMLKEQGDLNRGDLDDVDGLGPGGDYDDDGNNSQGSGKRSRTRRPHLQGRFSGRLTTKEDERRLAEECKLLGPLLGGVGKRGDKSRLTLAKIVRGIATGEVRRFCEERERGIGLLKSKLAAIDPEAAASVPINPIPLPSAQLGGMGMGGMGMGGMSMGSMGAPSSSMMGGSMGPGHSQHDSLMRENHDLQSEVYHLRSELQARERLLLELQDTGIISGFVPTSIPLDDAQRGAAGAAGGMGPGGNARSHSTEMGAPGGAGGSAYGGMGARYGGGGYGGQMNMPQSSAHLSSGVDAGGVGGGAASMAPGPIAAASVPVGGGSLGPDGAPLAAMPAMSEHSRASRPHKRPAPAPPGAGVDMGPGGSGTAALYGGGAGDLVPRSMSHPVMSARGAAAAAAAAAAAGGAGAGGFPHIDLQQQLNSLQAQVEHLQNLSQAQGAGRGTNFIMPARERAGAPVGRVPGGGEPYGRPPYGGGGGAGGGNGNATSPFLSSLSGPQGGLLMMPGIPGSGAGGSAGGDGGYNQGLSALHMQTKPAAPPMYDTATLEMLLKSEVRGASGAGPQ
ncbi:hypothetical protein HYH02_004125 [Chlamydomonas schloesseri]|uniref:Uncharacterized protein n=1 Tax=Chlamydomonas schloesseri TaxID=2026947 RepID=A0A835WPK1_9CHLO|nr:hypothetical protein HYH02_004125 [Chlamydomonas schloesseri]|eukprot:KAG2451527.1 hypothetical protein HYH02_004125 [Chlamydomonas schloesseri]